MIPLVILWVLFFTSHSLLAANNAKDYAQNLLGGNFKYYRLGFNFLSLLFLSVILYILLLRQEMDLIFSTGYTTSVTGLGLMASGFIIMILSFLNYDLAEFTGFKQLARQIHHSEKLVVKGLNAYVRNPLYFGIIIFILGFFVFEPTRMNFATLLIIYAYIYIGTRLEEKKLEILFGEEYRNYQRQVKMLIPYLF